MSFLFHGRGEKRKYCNARSILNIQHVAGKIDSERVFVCFLFQRRIYPVQLLWWIGFINKFLSELFVLLYSFCEPLSFRVISVSCSEITWEQMFCSTRATELIKPRPMPSSFHGIFFFFFASAQVLVLSLFTLAETVFFFLTAYGSWWLLTPRHENIPYVLKLY